MKPLVLLGMALLALPGSARAAGYALHGTFFEPGTAGTSRRVPAVLFVGIRGREVRLMISAPAARCVPVFGASGYVGPARGEGSDTLAVHVEQKGDCAPASGEARLYLRFNRDFPKTVSMAELTDEVGEDSDAPVLFQAN